MKSFPLRAHEIEPVTDFVSAIIDTRGGGVLPWDEPLVFQHRRGVFETRRQGGDVVVDLPVRRRLVLRLREPLWAGELKHSNVASAWSLPKLKAPNIDPRPVGCGHYLGRGDEFELRDALNFYNRFAAHFNEHEKDRDLPLLSNSMDGVTVTSNRSYGATAISLDDGRGVVGVLALMRPWNPWCGSISQFQRAELRRDQVRALHFYLSADQK